MSNDGYEEKTKLLSDKKVSGIPNVDQGWAWAVLLGGCVCSTITLGMPSIVGVLYVDIQETLQVSLIDTSFIGSLQTSGLFLSAIIVSPLVERIGYRVSAVSGSLMTCTAFLVSFFVRSIYVYDIFLGVIAGVGFSVVYCSAILCLNSYFDRRRSFAIMIYLGASGIGVIAFGPLLSLFLEHYGLEGTLLITAAICLNTLVGAMVFSPRRHNVKEHKHQKGNGFCRVYLDKAIWTNTSMYAVLSSAFTYGMGYVIAFTLLPEYIESNGISVRTSSLSITAIGVTSMAARFIIGCISNNFPGANCWMYVLGGIFAGGSLLLIPLCKTASQFIIVAAVYGIFYGTVSGLLVVILSECLVPEKLPVSIGIMMFVFGVGSLIGSPLAGTIAEMIPLSGVEFVFGGASYIATGLFMLPLLVTSCRHQTKYDMLLEDNATNSGTQQLLAKHVDYRSFDKTNNSTDDAFSSRI